MDRDWVERDRLLSEVHSDVKHMVEWAKSHDQSDNNRFKAIGERVSWVEKVAYLGIGGLAVLNIVLKVIH
jgi:hypothetical protein